MFDAINSGDSADVDLNAFYTTLHRMTARDKWIARKKDATGDDARINVYWITGEGLKALHRSIEQVQDLAANYCPALP
ncbi:MAG: hypothetical protein AAGB93_00635 [Planctomycetota bacterium]